MGEYLSKWCDVGTFHFKKKHIKKPAIELDAGFFIVFEGMKLSLVPPKLDFPRTCTITKIFSCESGLYVCQLNNETDVVFYEKLDGMHALALKKDVEVAESLDLFDFTGWTLISTDDSANYNIVGYEEMPTQILLHVATDESSDEMLVPLVDDFIENIDAGKCLLTCRFPFSIQDL